MGLNILNFFPLGRLRFFIHKFNTSWEIEVSRMLGWSSVRTINKVTKICRVTQKYHLWLVLSFSIWRNLWLGFYVDQSVMPINVSTLHSIWLGDLYDQNGTISWVQKSGPKLLGLVQSLGLSATLEFSS